MSIYSKSAKQVKFKLKKNFFTLFFSSIPLKKSDRYRGPTMLSLGRAKSLMLASII